MAAMDSGTSYLALMHLKAMHPERADQLQDIADCIRNCANDKTKLILDYRELGFRYQDLHNRYHNSFCQKFKRFFKPAIKPDLA
jgi:hypothetical protein